MNTEVASFKADHEDSSPLYMQVARALMQQVKNGLYKLDQALPSERALSEQMSVSRVTARKAIDQLVAQGMVVRKRGSGNYIAAGLSSNLSRLHCFTEQIKQRGLEPGNKWIKRTVAAASIDEQISLGLAPGERVSRLERLRLADGQVMAYEICVLPQKVLPDPEFFGDSLYEHLAKSDQVPSRALQQIHPVLANHSVAQFLDMPAGQPVLYVTRVSYLPSGEAIELTFSYCKNLSIAQTPSSPVLW